MDIVVTADGFVDWGQGRRRCALGRGGIGDKKSEGDAITPRGVWPFRRLYYRADRMAAPVCVLEGVPIRPDDGWCDAPADPAYNRLVRLPFAASHERLWRTDGLYDLVMVLGFNDDPVVPGKGSAIFLHLAKPGYGATEGCVALAREDALAGLAQLRAGDCIRIG